MVVFDKRPEQSVEFTLEESLQSTEDEISPSRRVDEEP